MIQTLLNLVFPVDCVLCGTRVVEWASGPVCRDCEAQLQPLPPPYCMRCGLPTLAVHRLCGACLTGTTGFDFGRAALALDPRLRQLIHQFKYNGRFSLARPLGRALRNCFESAPFTADVVIPVPLHPSREQQRGYNQAALLASQLRRGVVTYAVRRVRDTESQTGLSRRQRVANIRSAFRCRQRVTGTVLIVDDVLTTGATVSELARVLRRHGASRVEVLTLARVGTNVDQEGTTEVE